MNEKNDLKATLAVNGVELELNRFINDFVAQVTAGMVLSLKGVGRIKSVQIQLKSGKALVTVNGRHIPTDSYANDMITATVTGMVAALKGGSNSESVLISVDAPIT